MAKENRKKQKKNKKMLIINMGIMLMLSFTVIVIAKFFKEEHTSTQFNGENIATYHIELNGSQIGTELTQELLLSDLNPGDDRNVDFYITNGNADKKIYSDVSMDYEIQIIHTDNMPLIYELYDEKGNKLSCSGTSKDDEKYNNTGTYMNYKNNNSGKVFTLELDKSKPETVVSHKYTLRILWSNDDESADFKYVKEIDFLYIKIKGQEHNPLKNN